MQNIFIAVGGSGAKVAEALVRLLAVGFPTKFDAHGTPTSAGGELQIWRLDPDRSSGAAHALKQAADEYAELLDALRQGNAPNQWGMEIERDERNQALVRHLDPLSLHEENQSVKTLRGILNSQGMALNGKPAESGVPLLSLFYAAQELDVAIDRGFYQKPFIGAPVMAVFAETLKDPNSPGGRQCRLSALEARPARFFLCGSLHGGTGACGLPVMGKFLGDYKKSRAQTDWHLGGCLLAPYCLPPAPPIPQLQEAQRQARSLDPDGLRAMVSDYVRQHGQVAPFNRMNSPEARHELVKQILLGFYAQQTDMTDRARHSLTYYKDQIAPYFNALYLIGKPTPDQLTEWSNGGETQTNPLNSAEIVAALAALNFFAGTHDHDNEPQTYALASSSRRLGDQMFLSDLPHYTLPTGNGAEKINPEKVLLATATMRHLLAHQFPLASGLPPDFKRLRNYYQAHPERLAEDQRAYPFALNVITNSINALLAPDRALGWEGHDHEQVSLLLSDRDPDVAAITERLQTGLMSKQAHDPLFLGQSQVSVSKKEFPEWAPAGNEFTRGDYLRDVWRQLLQRSTTATQV